MSSIFQAMPLYAWIIIACVIILGVVVLIKLKFFGNKLSESRQVSKDVNNETAKLPDVTLSQGLFGWNNNGGKRKNKNMKKRRKYKK
jgi:biopolymer transport protein ExbB/TolQ